MEARKLSEESLPFEVSLRIRHPSVDPVDLSRELGLHARHSFRAGDPRPSHSAATSAPYGESYWLGSIDLSSTAGDAWLSDKRDLELIVRQARKAMARDLGWALSLTAWRLLRAKTLFERIRVDGGEVTLLVGVCSSAMDGFTLTPEVSRIFSDLGITLEFDLAG